VTRPPSHPRSRSVRHRIAVGCGLVSLVVVSLGNGPVTGHGNVTGVVTETAGLDAPPEASAPAVVPTPSVGSYAPRAPLHPVAAVIGPATVETVRRHMEAGDHHRALLVAEEVAESADSARERAAARMLVGLLHREAERHNLASEAFTQVRAGQGPLAPLAAFYEAEQDLARGREWVAIRECEAYRKTWPRGDHAWACQRLIATAYAKVGKSYSARKAAEEYDQEHDNATITEQIELRIAEQARAEDPASAIPLLQRLAVHHDSPLTGRVAEERLAELRAQGFEEAVLPDSTEARKARAISLRDVKRKPEAWAAFEALMADAEEDQALARWVEGAAERFGWRTHNWDFLAEMYAQAYEEDPDAKHKWSEFRVLGRGGKHDEAADVALAAQKAHGASREWRRKHEYVGQTMLLAGRYPEAVVQFDTVAARGGWTGRRNRFFAGFASLMAGDAEGAVERFTALIEADRSYLDGSRYWRAKAYDLLEKPDLAEADRAWLHAEAQGSWYTIWLGQHDEGLPTVAPLARSGAWVGSRPVETGPHPDERFVTRQEADAWTTATASVPMARPVATESPRAAFGGLPWAAAAAPTMGEWTLGHVAPSIVERLVEDTPPASYAPSPIHDPGEASAAMARFAHKHGATWPELMAAHDLASVGLFDLSGPMMSRWFEDWKTRYRRGHADALRVRGMTNADWRPLFLHTRDHHHAARFTYEWWDSLEDPEQIAASYRLAYPLAHDHTVWANGRQHGIDPYMVMGLMRQESTYNSTAVSRVGASGAMQIMPTTGHLLADIARDTDFTAGDLEDPELAIGYGIAYLGLLMERFDGAFPLAVASYNGGPHNVSAWLAGTGSDMPMDAFVEHIPFRETRDYVKKVTQGYDAYVRMYGPEGASLVLPPTPRGDHPEVVDF